MKKALSLLPVLLALQAVFSTSAVSKGKLDHLKKYIGTYQHYKGPLFQDPDVKALLIKTFGPRLDHLINNLSVKGPVDLISNNIVITGNAPHMGGEEMAILVINLNNASLHGAIYSKGKIQIFSSVKKYSHLPISIKNWILIVNFGLDHRDETPENTNWYGRK